MEFALADLPIRYRLRELLEVVPRNELGLLPVRGKVGKPWTGLGAGKRTPDEIVDPCHSFPASPVDDQDAPPLVPLVKTEKGPPRRVRENDMHSLFDFRWLPCPTVGHMAR